MSERKVRECDIIDVDLPDEGLEEKPLTCPYCGHTSTAYKPVKWDKETECFICFKCGKEWRTINGKTVKVNAVYGKAV
jgi:transcription elongation factor Elf1